MKKLLLTLFILTISAITFAQPANHLNFNGDNQCMRIPHHQDFNIETSESFTVTCWVNAANYNNFPRYVAKRDYSVTAAGNERSGYEMFGHSEAGKSYGLNTPTTTSDHAYSAYSGVTVNVGQWQHVAFVLDRANDQIRMYHNGVNTNTSSNSVATWTVANSFDLYIGAGYNGGVVTNYCNGDFGNIRFYSIALSDEQMLTDMNNSALCNIPSSMQNALIAAYDFAEENINENHLTDLSGNGHTADLVGFSFGNPEIQNVTLTQDNRMTGRGCQQDIILKAAVDFGGTNQSVDLNSMTINLDGTTNLNDIEEVKIYTTGLTSSFNWRTAENATLLGTCNPTNGDIVCNLSGELLSGTNYLWITAHVADDATEGNFIDASLKSITTVDETYEVANPSPSGDKEIILCRTTIYMGGDYNSSNYRIPAILIADDGSLVIATDKRKYNSDDLPADIDVLSNRSTDGGRTWSEPVTVALGTGYNHGYGDCALVKTNVENEILAGFCGGPGCAASTVNNPLRTYIARSHDNGVTWDEPIDITDYICGANCIYPEHRTWRGSFFASGNGLKTSTGRIIFVGSVLPTSAFSFENYAFYSDDNGVTWQVSQRASTNGNEAKVVELADGRILMSIRNSGYRKYVISEDGGETWQATTSTWYDIQDPSCNGDLIRYTSVNQGYNKNRLLHSIPFDSSRKKVSVLVSYDEGETWPMKRTIVPYNSAYSSLCILDDGTIGLYTEEQYSGEPTYTMVFYNFSLEWLTRGEDIYEPVASVAENGENQIVNEIYPTITSTIINVKANDLNEIRIVDVKGNLVKTVNVNNEGIVTVDVSDLASGMYFVEGKGKFIVR